MNRIKIILKKEWWELSKQRGLVLGTLLLPVVITLLAVGLFYVLGQLPPDAAKSVTKGNSGDLAPFAPVSGPHYERACAGVYRHTIHDDVPAPARHFAKRDLFVQHRGRKDESDP